MSTSSTTTYTRANFKLNFNGGQWTYLLNCWQSEEFISRIGYLALGTVEVVVDSVVCYFLDTWTSELPEGGC